MRILLVEVFLPCYFSYQIIGLIEKDDITGIMLTVFIDVLFH